VSFTVPLMAAVPCAQTTSQVSAMITNPLQKILHASFIFFFPPDGENQPLV
jgi:hypothetical protein